MQIGGHSHSQHITSRKRYGESDFTQTHLQGMVSKSGSDLGLSAHYSQAYVEWVNAVMTQWVTGQKGKDSAHL